MHKMARLSLRQMVRDIEMVESVFDCGKEYASSFTFLTKDYSEAETYRCLFSKKFKVDVSNSSLENNPFDKEPFYAVKINKLSDYRN
jgi:hypothetical protein